MYVYYFDLSQNGINSIGYIEIQNSTSKLNSYLLEQIYLDNNRGLSSFSTILYL